MTKKKKDKVKKGDLERVVISETSPYEVPIVFLNHGFYNHCVEYKSGTYALLPLFDKIVKSDSVSFVPHMYKIRRDEISLRTLSLLHPASQYRFVQFYEEYGSLICHYCSGSPFSLRYPKKIAGTIYYKNESANINKYKNNNINTVSTDLIAKHPAAYFAYGGYGREYKFYKSVEFLELEKKYNTLWLLDVSKCFDSIYTHSISWALKSKNFTKNHLQLHTFGENFDLLMRSAKHNETNGIVIGPEISRIFAEIILQDVDQRIIDDLSKDDLKFGDRYVIKRYVDDIFVFAKDDSVAQKVARTASAQLFNYNLHLNEAKHKRYVRPFFTPKSRIIFEVDTKIREFLKKFTFADKSSAQKEGDSKYYEDTVSEGLVPTEIHNLIGLRNSFINSVKSILSAHADANQEANIGDYSIASNYIISSLSRRVTEIVESGTKHIKKDKSAAKRYSDAILCLIETMFFFYTVEPSVLASYHLSRSIILAARFSNIELPEHEASIKQKILELFIKFYESTKLSEEIGRKEATSLEVINILLALGDMGEDYLLPVSELKHIFKISDAPDCNLSYFEMMSCLYYIKARPIYKELNTKLTEMIEKCLRNLEDVERHAESAYILLDTLSCPYIDAAFRKKILNDLNVKMQIDLSTIGDGDAQLSYIEARPWFIKWENIDLLTLLEKKELSAVY